jgi:hypothetical protein
MPECQSCGGFVTKDFARVFGTNDGEVYACPDCATMVELADDALAATGR